MYEPIWQAVKDELSGEHARDFTARIWEHARWNSFDGIGRTAGQIAAIMREIGLEEVEVRQYPADGVTAHGGWVMPQAWDAQDATLEIVDPPVADPVIANYRHCPQSLMMYSAPTAPEGLVSEVVVVDRADRAESYEGRDVAGKIVLADGVGLDIGLCAFARGAGGIVSDAMKLAGSPHEKSPGHFDNACQWHNYTIPPWKDRTKGWGFSVSPVAGRRLRELLGGRGSVKLRAVVRTRLYDGVIPVVTGLLPGRTHEEIALTGHLCEPGANDNSSGCALGLEIARTIRSLRDAGRLPELRRGLRLVFSFEVRGYQAFLADWPRLNRLVAGMNLDMVGNDQSEARARANLVFNYPTLPAYTDVLGVELAERLRRDDPLFRYQTMEMGLVDNLFGIPAVGAPMCVLGNWADAYYHTSLDRIETICPRAMAHFGRLAGTYCAFLACAGFREAAWLARMTAAWAQRRIVEAARRGIDAGRDADALAEELGRIARKNAARLRSIGRLVPGRSVVASPTGLRQNKDWLCGWSHLFRDVQTAQHLQRLGEGLVAFAAREARRLRAEARYARRTGSAPKVPAGAETLPTAQEHERACGLVPLSTFRGAICFESLDEAARAELKAKTGLGVSWGAPEWLQLTVFQSNGKRTAWEIWQWLKGEARPPALGVFRETIEFLARHGFVRLRPVLRKADYLAALRAVGLPRGATVMVHSSLSLFGYVQGSAQTVIEALLEAIGPEGTLAMPALSCSWVGRPPFDLARTPSRVGAITEVFRRLPGVIRSPHPTHSVSALGPLAERITRDHTPDGGVFGERSAFARLYELDAWIMMLCKLSSNTSMHMAEERAGLLRTDLVGHVLAGGRRREVPVLRAPWHVNFDGHYELLRQRSQLRSAPLGEGTIHLMRARDAVDAALENVRKDPLLATAKGCECEFCKNVRAHLGEGDAQEDRG